MSIEVEVRIEPSEARAGEPSLPELRDLVDAELLERSGLDNPYIFTLQNGSGVPTHYYVGSSFKDVKSFHEMRLIVSEERKETEISGQEVKQVWRATLMPESKFEEEDRREEAVQEAIRKQIRMRSDQIGALVGNLIPRPPRGPR